MQYRHVAYYDQLGSVKGILSNFGGFRGSIPVLNSGNDILTIGYPTMAGKLYLCHMNKVVSKVVNTTISLFSKDYQQKMLLLSNNAADMNILTKTFDLNILPISFGGTNYTLYENDKKDEDCLLT